jgi:hypothetical protein
MADELPGSLRELAQFQRGVLSRKQALSGGLTKDALRSRVQLGRWQRLHAGVYAVFSGEPGRQAALWAAVLRAGDGAILSYHTAAELFGLIDEPSTVTHVTIPGYRRVSRIPGLAVHRATGADRARHPALTPPRTRIEETVLDLAQRSATPEASYGWVTHALGRGLTTQLRLADALGLRARTRWRAELTEILTADWHGIHSALEHRYVRDVERPHGLPRGTRQARVRRGSRSEYRDVLYDAYRIAVELDGRAAHPTDARWQDIRRDNAAAADGVLTLRYGWIDVSRNPCSVASQVARALRQRGYAGARPCSAGCPVSPVG